MGATHAGERTPRLAPLFAGAAFGLVVLTLMLLAGGRDAEEAGLGIATSSGIAAHPRGPFEFNGVDATRTLPRAMAARGLPVRGLVLGASQLYGINAFEPGQRTVGYRLFDSLAPEGLDLGVVGLPNATPREHLVLLAALAPRLEPDILVVGAVYDDMRHPEIRNGVREAAARAPARAVLSGLPAGRAILAEGGMDSSTPSAGSDRAERDAASWMARTEAWLTGRLKAVIGFESWRRDGRAATLLALGDIRRFLESLRARWTRDLSRYRVPIPPAPYAANLEAWESLLKLARARGLRTLVYIAPRPADFFPYDPTGYARFKADLDRLTEAHDAGLISIEDAVPPRLWGEVDIAFGFPVRDPFHFRAEGHRLMARALEPHIREMLAAEAGE